MKYELIMKDRRGVDNLLESIYVSGQDDDDEHSYEESEKVKNILEKYFKYSEYVTLIVDTENNTLTVEPL